MAIPVYARLQWDGRHGHATCGDVDVTLHESPHALGDPCEIDYSEVHPGQLGSPPEIRVRAHDKRREMEPPEVAAVRALLRGLLGTVDAFLKGRQ